MSAAIRHKNTQLPRQAGERARLKVLRGPDYGAVYVLTGPRASVGRGEECDVVIADLKASRKHAEFVETSGGWEVRDLGSANGILVNGQAATIAKLGNGTTVTVGETVLDFVGSEQPTLSLMAPPRDVARVVSEQVALQAQKEKIHGGLKLPGGRPVGGPVKARDPKKLLLVGVVGLAAALFVLGPNQNAPKPAKKKKENDPAAVEDLTAYLPGPEGAPLARAADTFFRQGFREYTQGNYLRARQQFEQVLQMAPSHELARLYLTNSKKRLDDEVKSHLQIGRRSLKSGKLRDAKGHFEEVLRILWREQDRPEFSDAKEQLEKVNSELVTSPAESGGG